MVFSVDENDDHFELGVTSKYTSSTILKNADTPFVETIETLGRARAESKLITTPIRISRLKSEEYSPLKMEARISLMEDDPEPDNRLDEENFINKPLIYTTNSNSKSMTPFAFDYDTIKQTYGGDSTEPKFKDQLLYESSSSSYQYS